MLSTYLLRRRGEPSEPMKRFIERAKGGRDRACR
ncbi:MAG: LysR family transcriptional regulator, partial [Gammaproteobacteria bacterium]